VPTIGEPDERVSAYAEAAVGHGRATVAGDSNSANEAYDRLAAIYRELREEGQRERLLSLLHHAVVAVRTWAAAHALEFAPDEGERVLTEIAATDQGILGLDAEQTLSVWRNGELSFP
jgi:hypothetical protein